jgi:hypothetical protein
MRLVVRVEFYSHSITIIHHHRNPYFLLKDYHCPLILVLFPSFFILFYFYFYSYLPVYFLFFLLCYFLHFGTYNSTIILLQ